MAVNLFLHFLGDIFNANMFGLQHIANCKQHFVNLLLINFYARGYTISTEK